jgi:putative DNA primase/helicase
MPAKDKAAGLGTTAASRSDYTHNYSTNDIGRIRDALSFIPAADRDTWLQMAMAVKSELGDPGFDLWDAWSQQADSYNAKDARDVWKSLKANGRVTAGTLFYEAKARGWRDDGTRQKPTAEEIEARRRQSAERAAKQEVEKARERAEAREKAAAIWMSATPTRDDHPYLVRKGVSSVPSLRENRCRRGGGSLGLCAEVSGRAPRRAAPGGTDQARRRAFNPGAHRRGRA